MPLNELTVYELNQQSKFQTIYTKTSLEVCASVAYAEEDILAEHNGVIGTMYAFDIQNVPEQVIQSNFGSIHVIQLQSLINHIVQATRDGKKLPHNSVDVSGCMTDRFINCLKLNGVKYSSRTEMFTQYKPRAKSDQSDTELLAKFRRYVPSAVATLMKTKYDVELSFIHCKTIDKIANVVKLAQTNGFTVDDVVTHVEYQLSYYVKPEEQSYIDTVARFKEWYNKVVDLTPK